MMAFTPPFALPCFPGISLAPLHLLLSSPKTRRRDFGFRQAAPGRNESHGSQLSFQGVATVEALFTCLDFGLYFETMKVLIAAAAGWG